MHSYSNSYNNRPGLACLIHRAWVSRSERRGSAGRRRGARLWCIKHSILFNKAVYCFFFGFCIFNVLIYTPQVRAAVIVNQNRATPPPPYSYLHSRGTRMLHLQPYIRMTRIAVPVRSPARLCVYRVYLGLRFHYLRFYVQNLLIS